MHFYCFFITHKQILADGFYNAGSIVIEHLDELDVLILFLADFGSLAQHFVLFVGEIAGLEVLAGDFPIVQILGKNMYSQQLLIGTDLHLVGDNAALDSGLGHDKDHVFKYKAGLACAGETAEHGKVTKRYTQCQVIEARAVFAVVKTDRFALIEFIDKSIIEPDVFHLHILSSVDRNGVELIVKEVIDFGI